MFESIYKQWQANLTSDFPLLGGEDEREMADAIDRPSGYLGLRCNCDSTRETELQPHSFAGLRCQQGVRTNDH